MRSYSFTQTSAFIGVEADVSTVRPVKIVALRWYGEAQAATVQQVTFIRCSAISTGLSTEKLNSRSPAASIGCSALNVNTATAMVLGAANFSRGSWFPSFFTYIIPESGVAVVGLNSGAVSNSNNMICSIGDSPWARCRTNRRASDGKFCVFGSEISNQQKTGSGAFQIFAPHFDNDITWCDTSAWRNGSHQSDTWNINLFGTVNRKSFAYMNGV